MAAARVLLFGATGFLGRAAAEALCADPRTGEVIAAGRRPAEGLQWVRHDLVSDSPSALAALLTDLAPDAVVNCAGRLTGTDVELVAANTGAVATLIDTIAVAAPAARLVTFGSAAEYGVITGRRPVRETDPALPVSGYGVTRLAATRLVTLAAQRGALDAVVLRVFNPVGPGLPAENLAGRAVRQIRGAVDRGEDRIRMGPLGSCRDFVDVRDVARAVAAAAHAPRLSHPVCNVGSGAATAARVLVRLLADAAGFTGTIEESEPESARSPGVDWIAADIAHTAASLGWAPRYSLAESADHTWANNTLTPA